MKSTVGQPTSYVLKNGKVKYEIEISHEGLSQYQVIRADDIHVLHRKASTKIEQWDAKWQKQVAAEEKKQAAEDGKEEAQERTEEAQFELDMLEGILEATLFVDDTIDWDSLKNVQPFSVPKPVKQTVNNPQLKEIPPEPDASFSKYLPELGFFDQFIRSWREKKEMAAEERFRADHEAWRQEQQVILEENAQMQTEADLARKRAEEEFQAAVNDWNAQYNAYINKQEEDNTHIELKKKQYFAQDAEAVYDYCEMVLSNSQYPDYFPQRFDLQYNPGNKILIVDFQLPGKEDLPTLKTVKYVVSKREYTEQHISGAALNKMYDSVLYQIALRTIHELYEADQAGALESVVFNGYVDSIDPATGHDQNVCILSLQAGKEEFLQINLKNIEPRACFKNLKGVGSAKLSTITPVAPLLKMEKEDRRFVSSYDVAENIQEGDNLAMMDWEDFEHLVREIFEKEFAATGGEVKVTRASKDGGIDAVVFDPDPLRGGKIVIQAKRYANTVGVSAVRDLYGTMINEGANKGILVSTADYGPDAYAFAKGKPLTLLNGGNLLHLLEKHGHKARIDLKEAKLALAAQR